jgi:hypothetical protein
MAKDTVLIIADEDDPHAQNVAREVEQTLNGKAVILNPLSASSKWELILGLSEQGETAFTLSVKDYQISNKTLAGVWCRDVDWLLALAGRETDSPTELPTLSALALLREWLLCMGERVTNPLASLFSSTSTVFVAQQAAAHGLRVRRTLTTNSQDAARSFCGDAASAVIATSFKTLSNAPGRSSGHRLAHGEFPPGFPSIGAVFQERPDGKEKVEVTVVHNAVFSVSYPAACQAVFHDGWLNELAASTRTHTLPQDMSESLVALVRSLKLSLCTFKLQVSLDDEYVLLEAYPCGGFLFAELHTGLPISRALASSLLGKG